MVWLYRTSKLAIQNFWRNLWLSVITLFILILTLFSISMIASLNLAAGQAIQAVKDKVDVDIFFNPQIAESEILRAQVFLEDLPQVKEVTYISQDMALENFKVEHENDVTIQESLTNLSENPLPASLVIRANNLEDYEAILTQFENSEFNKYVQDKNYSNHKLIIDKLSLITKRIYNVGIIVSLIFIFFSIVMVYNTIRVTIYSHREELNIMRLVGATNWFIRAPFLLEGVLYALIASITAMLLIYPIVLLASPYINNLFAGYNFDMLYYFYQYIWQIFTLQLLLSLLLSSGSSMVAIGRYLKS